MGSYAPNPHPLVGWGEGPLVYSSSLGLLYRRGVLCSRSTETTAHRPVREASSWPRRQKERFAQSLEWYLLPFSGDLSFCQVLRPHIKEPEPPSADKDYTPHT